MIAAYQLHPNGYTMNNEISTICKTAAWRANLVLNAELVTAEDIKAIGEYLDLDGIPERPKLPIPELVAVVRDWIVAHVAEGTLTARICGNSWSLGDINNQLTNQLLH